MNSKKNMVNVDEDLKFIPLNLKEPFKSKDSSWVPCINMDIPTNNMTNNFFMGLPDLQNTQGLTALPNMNTDQMPPYSSTFSTPSPFALNNANMNLNNNSNMQPNNMQSNSNNNLNPNNAFNPNNNTNPNNNLNLNNTPNQNNNFNPNNIIDENELYPSEGPQDELYSYNTDNNNNNNMNRSIDNLIHLDILRDFDLSLDSDITTDNRDDSNITIDKVFNDIEDNNNGLLSTLKSYRMPYPIATLVIKKIIKATLDHSNKE